MILAKRSFVKCGEWFKEISHCELYHRVFSSIRVVNKSENKIAVCEKTAGLGSGNFSDLNSASWKVLVPVKIFHF